MSDRRPTKPSSSSSKPSASKSTTVARSGLSILMGKLDKSKDPSSSQKPGTAMPKLDKSQATSSTQKPSSAPKTGYLTAMPKLDKSKPSSSSSKLVTQLPTSARPVTKMPASSSRTEQPSTSLRNDPSERLTTTLRTTYDQKMASRQTKIKRMAPREREEQEQWAREQLKENSGACNAGFDWERSDDIWPGFNGYQCQGTNHFVTDQLIAEGKGRCYIAVRRPFGGVTSAGIMGWDGPYDEEYFAAMLGMTVEQHREYMKRMRANMGSLAGVMAGLGIGYPQGTGMGQGGYQQGGRQTGSLRDTMANHGFFPVGRGAGGGRPGFPAGPSGYQPRYDRVGRPY